MQRNQLMIQSHTAIGDSSDYRFQKSLKGENRSMVSYITAISDPACQNQLWHSMFLSLRSAEKYEIMFNQRQLELLTISSAFDLPAQSVGKKSII